MQLHKPTLDVLKNFSAINTNLVIREGNKIETISPSKDVLASFTSEDEFDTQMSIYNLNEFLGVLGAFEKPELELEDKYVNIVQGKQKVMYLYAEESFLVVPPVKGITFPTADISFDLTDAMLSKLLKMSSILGAGDLAVIGNGETISLKVFDKKTSSSTAFEFDIEVPTTQTFQVNFLIEKLKLMQGSYKVDISSKNISRFTHSTIDLYYLISVETDSTF